MCQAFLILFVVILIGYVLYERKKQYEKFWKYIYAIPGPDYIPIIGNTQTHNKVPVELFEIGRQRLKKYGPIYKSFVCNVAIVTISNPEDIEIILSSMKHITKDFSYKDIGLWLGNGVLTSTGSKWQQRRKMLTPAFHFNILQDFVKIFNKEADNLLEYLKSMSNRPHVNLLEPITDYALNCIGETSLGVDMNLQPKRDEYKRAIYKFGEIFMIKNLRPWLLIPFIFKMNPLSDELEDTLKVLHDFSTSIFHERKKSFKELRNTTKKSPKRMSLIDLLLNAKYNSEIEIDDSGIREEIDTFMFAGHDTTTLAISYLLLTLANEPQWQENVREEICEVLGDTEEHPSFQQLGKLKLLERCVKETIRLYPIVPVISRVAEEDIKTATGYIIPRGTNIHVHIFGMHRSEAVWENPDKFDPDRFLPENSSKRHPFSFVGFSAGPRNCLGQRFASLEIKAVVCRILRNFILEPIDKPEDIVFKADLVLRPQHALRVKFVPRR